MIRLITTMVIALVLGFASPAGAGGIALGGIGTAKVRLNKGSVTVKTKGLAQLPVDVDTGNGVFTAYLYKAYVNSSTDPAVEIFVGDLYPNVKGKAVAKLKLKGDISLLGINQIVVVAFSKDATQSFDIATAAIQ